MRHPLSLTNLTLRKRVILIVLAGLVVGLGLFSWLGVGSLNESTRRILDERLTIARVMASHLDETLANILLLSQDFNFDNGLPNKEQFTPMASSLRKTLAKSGIMTRHIFLVGRDGTVLQLEPDEPELVGTDMTIYPEVKSALETGLSTVSSLVSGPLMKVPVVLATAPVFDEEGKTIGALTGSIDIEQSRNDAFNPILTVGETGYMEIVDGNGIVLARSKPGSPPAEFERSDHPGRFAALISEGKATVRTCHRCHETNNTVKRRRDVLAFAPLSTAYWGIAIRQSEEEALAPTRRLETRLLLLGMVILAGTLALLWTILRGVVKPIIMLTFAAERVAAGDFNAVTPAERRDEIGQLSSAFHSMTMELAKARDKLVSRNEELSAVNSIAATVNQSLNLDDVLENTMRKVLQVTRSSSGCIFLKDATSGKLEIMSCIDPSGVFDCQESSSPIARCACHQVLDSGQSLMVNHVAQCPRLDEHAGLQHDIGCFTSVPLKSKDKIIGVMNVACSDDSCFTEDDFRFLDSIGYHVGLAIENSVLYEEAKQNEQLRGQLLNSVITAQEKERKRIARELHDEYGQTLTGVIMSIEALENMNLPQQSQLSDKLKTTKSLAIKTLEDMRRLTLDLRPSALDDLGLIAAIRSYAKSHLEAAGVEVKFESEGISKRLPPTVETALFRILQEAMHNISKHAGAHKVRIHLGIRGSQITATVADDGRGFDVQSVFKSRVETQSLGILGIQERTKLLGGTFTIESHIGQGTKLTVEIPLPDTALEPPLTLKQVK